MPWIFNYLLLMQRFSLLCLAFLTSVPSQAQSLLPASIQSAIAMHGVQSVSSTSPGVVRVDRERLASDN